MRVPRGPGRRLAALVAALFIGLLAAGPVSAHAELVSSDPEANASLTESPESLSLNFTEPLDRANATVELLDPAQQAVDGLGEPVLADQDRTLTVSLPQLEAGVYVVAYQVLSTVDGHVTSGSFAFQIDPTGSAPAPNVAPTSEAPTADLATAVTRWVALASGLALFGTVFFWLFSGRPSVGFAKVELGRLRMWRVFRVAALLTVFGLLTYLAFASRGLPGRETGVLNLDPVAAFGWTPFAIAMRVALVGSILAFLWASGWSLGNAAAVGRRRDLEAEPAHERLALVVLLSLAGITLLGFSFAGHVAAIGGPPFALLDWGHLLGVGVWLGSLPGFLLFWLLYARRAVDKRRRGMLGDAIARHSRFALAAGPVVALTGIANSPLVLGGGRNLVASDYGNLLLAKALLFSVAIGIGAANFFLVRRRALGTLLWTVSAEVAIAALAILTAAGLLTVPPAAARQPRLVTTPVATAHLYDAVDDLAVHTIVSVPAPGNQTYQVALSDADTGAPAEDLQRVFLVFTPPPDAGDLAEQRVETEPVPDRPGLFEARGAYTPVVGEWSIGVVLRQAGVPDERVDFSVPVVTPPPPERLPPEDTGIDVPAPLGALWGLIPPAPYEWLPALSLFGLAGVLWVAAPTRGRASTARSRRVAVLRTSIVALAVGATLVTGSQALVLTANAGGDPVLPTQNPVAPTEESIAAGEAAFRATCATCHGVEGRGDGPAADGLSVRPSDLSLHVPFHTDAELFAFATRGISGTPMPGFAQELSAEDRWNLINYLRSRWPAE